MKTKNEDHGTLNLFPEQEKKQIEANGVNDQDQHVLQESVEQIEKDDDIPLENIIERANKDFLLKVLKKLNGKTSYAKKEDYISRIKEIFLNTPPKQILNYFTEEEKLILQEAIYNNGKIQIYSFRSKYNVKFPSPSDFRYYFGWDNGSDTEPPLLGMLSIYDDDFKIAFFSKTFLNKIKLEFPKPEDWTVTKISEIPQYYEKIQEKKRTIHKFTAEQIALPELIKVLDLVYKGKIKVTEKLKMPTKSSIDLIREELILPEYLLEIEEEIQKQDKYYNDIIPSIRSSSWIKLIQQCGWAKASKAKLDLTQTGKLMRLEPTIENFKKGFERFIKDSNFDEFNMIVSIGGQKSKEHSNLTNVSDRKRSIIKTLNQVPNTWINVNEFYRLGYNTNNAFTVCNDLWRLYLSNLGPEHGNLAYGENGKQGIEKLYLKALFMCSLATLGCIDVAYIFPHGLWFELNDDYLDTDYDTFCSYFDGLLYIRLNDFGRYLLGLSNEYQPSIDKEAIFTLLPNNDLILKSKDISQLKKLYIEKIAIKTGELTYVLDLKKILNCIEEGLNLNEIHNFLKNNAENAVPEVVGHFFEKTIKSKIINLKNNEEVILLNLEDENLAALIAHDSKIKKYCYLLDKKYIIINKAKIKNFYSALRNINYIMPDIFKKYDVK